MTICKKCGEPIAWQMSKGGKYFPVNADHDGKPIRCSDHGSFGSGAWDFHKCYSPEEIAEADEWRKNETVIEPENWWK